MLLFGLAIVGRIIYIQVAEREELLEYANKFGTRIIETEGMRGNIFSKNNTIIATTIPVYDIHFDPVAVVDSVYKKNVKALADSLSVMFKNYSKSQYVSKLNKARDNNKRYVKIAKRLKKDDYERLRSFPIFNCRNNGLIVEKQYVRERPYGDIAMRTVGYVIPDAILPCAQVTENEYSSAVRCTSDNRLCLFL